MPLAPANYKIGQYFREFDNITGDFIIPSKPYGEEINPLVDTQKRSDLICMRIMVRKKALPLGDEQRHVARQLKRKGSFGRPPPPVPAEPKLLRSNSVDRGIKEQPEVTMFDQMRGYLHDETEITPGVYKPTGEVDLLQRDRLRFDPGIIALLHAFWSAADTDASDAEGEPRIETSRQAADLWTENVNEYEYRQLLKCVLKSIIYEGVTPSSVPSLASIYEGYKGRHFFRPITEVEPGCAVRMFREKMKRRKFHAARAKQLSFLRHKAMGVIRQSAPLAACLDVRCYLEARVHKMTSLELIELGYHVEPAGLADWLDKHGFDLEAVGPVNAGAKVQSPEEAVRMVEQRAAALWRKGVANTKQLQEHVSREEKRAAVVRLIGASALEKPLEPAPPPGTGAGRRRSSLASAASDPSAVYDPRGRDRSAPRGAMQTAARAGGYGAAALPKGFHVKVLQSLKGMREALEKRGADKAKEAAALLEAEKALGGAGGGPPALSSRSLRRVHDALLGDDESSSSSGGGESSGDEAGGAGTGGDLELLEDTVGSGAALGSVPEGVEEYPDLEALERAAGGEAAAEAAAAAERALVRGIVSGKSSRRFRLPKEPSQTQKPAAEKVQEEEPAPTPPPAPSPPPPPERSAEPRLPAASELLRPRAVASSLLSQLVAPSPARPGASRRSSLPSAPAPAPAVAHSLDSALPAVPGRRASLAPLAPAASAPARPASAGAIAINGPPQRRRVSLATGLAPAPPPARPPRSDSRARASARPPRPRRLVAPQPARPPPLLRLLLLPAALGRPARPAPALGHEPEGALALPAAPARSGARGAVDAPRPAPPLRLPEPRAGRPPRPRPALGAPGAPRPTPRRSSVASAPGTPATPPAPSPPPAPTPPESIRVSAPAEEEPEPPPPPKPRVSREERRASIAAALAKLEAAAGDFEGALREVRGAEPVLVPLAPVFPYAPSRDGDADEEEEDGGEGASPPVEPEPEAAAEAEKEAAAEAEEGSEREKEPATPEPAAAAEAPRAAAPAPTKPPPAAPAAAAAAMATVLEEGDEEAAAPAPAPATPAQPRPNVEKEKEKEKQGAAGPKGEEEVKAEEAEGKAGEEAGEGEEGEEEHRPLHAFGGHDLLSAIG
eukprot:tig00000361_g24360.t1